MRAKTCCTVSLKGETVLLRRSHSRKRCAQRTTVSPTTHLTAQNIHVVRMIIQAGTTLTRCPRSHLSNRKSHEDSEKRRTSTVAWAVADVASPAMPFANTGLEVMPTRPCIAKEVRNMSLSLTCSMQSRCGGMTLEEV